MYTVTINGYSYHNEVELQTAIDYVIFRRDLAQARNEYFVGNVVSAETGEIVYTATTYRF